MMFSTLYLCFCSIFTPCCEPFRSFYYNHSFNKYAASEHYPRQGVGARTARTRRVDAIKGRVVRAGGGVRLRSVRSPLCPSPPEQRLLSVCGWLGAWTPPDQTPPKKKLQRRREASLQLAATWWRSLRGSCCWSWVSSSAVPSTVSASLSRFCVPAWPGSEQLANTGHLLRLLLKLWPSPAAPSPGC